jgi:branched-chain amino acid transport system permease protein
MMSITSGILPTVFELLLAGVFLGTTYGLIALGLSLVFGVQYVINIAHGEFVMLGAYTTFFGYSLFNLHPLVSTVLAVPLLFMLGVLIQDQLLERIKDEPELTSLILTFGVSIALMNGAQAVFSADYRSLNYLNRSLTFAGARFGANRLLTFVATSLVLIGILAFLKYSSWGKAIRATSQAPDIAKACGINTRHVRLLSFGLGAATAGFAGSFLGMMQTIYPDMGFNFLVKAFVIVVLGGLGSVGGAIVAGMFFGVVEMFGSYILDSETANALAFVFLYVLLLAYPQGLFGQADPSVGGQ